MKNIKKIVSMCFLAVLICLALVGCSKEEQAAVAKEGYDVYLETWAELENKKNPNTPVTVEQLNESVISCNVIHLESYSTYYYKLEYRDSYNVSQTVYFIYLTMEGKTSSTKAKEAYNEAVKMISEGETAYQGKVK